MLSRNDAIRIEYEKSQDSAEHYNQLIWILIPVFFGFVFYVVANYESLNIPFLEKSGLIMAAAFALFLMGILVEGAHAKKVLKYAICNEIERKENFLCYGVLSTKLTGKDIINLSDSFGIVVIRWVRRLLIFLLALWALSILIESCASAEPISLRTFAALISFLMTAYILLRECQIKHPSENDILDFAKARAKQVYGQRSKK